MEKLQLINLPLLSHFKEKIDVLLEKKVNKTDIATTEQLGLIKPDNSTVFVDENGVLSSVGGSGGGGVSNVIEWGIASLTADVTTATPIGYVIPFNNYFTKSTVTMDKENHGFILKAGKTYELEASIRTLGNNAWRYFQFYDNNQQMYVGILGCCETTNSTADGIMPATLIVTPEVDTLYTVKVCNTSSETTTSTIVLQSHFKVVELTSSVAPVSTQVNYSTEEQVVGTWIDGKPLYQKTFSYGTLPNASILDIEHNIENIEEIWIISGWCKNLESGNILQLNTPNPNGNENSFYFSVNSTKIRCETGTDRTNYFAYVTIQYTKTTDTIT